MRVVAGTAKGRPIVAPAGRDVRPTGDRVREAVANALVSLDGLQDASVLDLFAGSGALGIEALSRGARHAVFVDRDDRALAAVRANLEATGLAERATVVTGTAEAYLAGRPGPFDVAFCDPPYAFADWASLLDGLAADLVVIESDREPDLPPGWGVVRSKRYGTTLVVFARPASYRAGE